MSARHKPHLDLEMIGVSADVERFLLLEDWVRVDDELTELRVMFTQRQEVLVLREITTGNDRHRCSVNLQ